MIAVSMRRMSRRRETVSIIDTQAEVGHAILSTSGIADGFVHENQVILRSLEASTADHRFIY